MRKQSKTALYKEERTWFFVACAVLLCVVALYIYFLSASVVHVVMRKEIDQEIASVGSSVSQLESQYIEEQHAVSNEIASMKGFVPADKKVFIDRAQGTLALSKNNDS